MGSSFGPVQTAKPKHGDCLYCFDENHTRDTGYCFESRFQMVGPVCGHRLRPFKRFAKPSRLNRYRTSALSETNEYWNRRALLPDYCGEPGERSNPLLAGLHKMDSAEAEAAVRSARCG